MWTVVRDNLFWPKKTFLHLLKFTKIKNDKSHRQCSLCQFQPVLSRAVPAMLAVPIPVSSIKGSTGNARCANSS
jgi:hypothetical protein